MVTRGSRAGRFSIKTAIVGDIDKIIEEDLEIAGKAITFGVADTAEDSKQRWRDQVTGAGLGRGLSKSIRVKRYPSKSTSMSAAALIYSNSAKIIRAFDEGAIIRPRDQKFLAIPTENAPRRGIGGKRISPASFPEGRYGPLKFVVTSRGQALLIVDNVRITRTGRVSRQVKGGSYTKTGRLKKGITSVVMFVLVPQSRLPKRLNKKSVEDFAARQLPLNILKRWRQFDNGK